MSTCWIVLNCIGIRKQNNFSLTLLPFLPDYNEVNMGLGLKKKMTISRKDSVGGPQNGTGLLRKKFI
jgi:hypothetical protein